MVVLNYQDLMHLHPRLPPYILCSDRTFAIKATIELFPLPPLPHTSNLIPEEIVLNFETFVFWDILMSSFQ
jgi:hypothetical protein